MRCQTLATIALLVVALVGHTNAEAQPYSQRAACNQPITISDQGPDTFALVPYVTIDSSGNLHAVWSGGTVERYPDTDAIFYTSFQDGQWLPPMDVLATNGDYVSVNSLLVTTSNHLIQSWVYRESGESGLRVSRSTIENAFSAQSWETTSIYATNITDSSLFIDRVGDIHLSFIVHDPANGTGFLGYTRSHDDGASWSEPIEFAPYDPKSVGRRFITLFANGAGLIQMAWAVSARFDDWSPVNIERTVSSDDGTSWSEPEELFAGPRANMPSYLQGAEPNQVYLTWMRGVGYSDSKYAMMSTDYGATWSEPKLIISEKRGMNGPMRMTVDSLGTEYLALAGDQTEIGTRIWISSGIGENSWSNPSPVSSSEFHESEFPQAVVRNGNELHVFWLDWGQREVFSVVCSLDSPETTATQGLSEGFLSRESTSAAVETPVPSLDPVNQPAPEQSELSKDRFSTNAAQAPSTGAVLAMSVLAPIILVGLVVVWQFIRRLNSH